MNVTLRRATQLDEDLIFYWRNLPEIYNLGKEKRSVEKNEHRLWFQSALQNTHHLFLIITFFDLDCGVIRYNRIKDQEWEVSIYIVEKRSKGIGKEALNLSYSFLPKGATIIANVLRNNAESIKFFHKNEFSEIKTDGSELIKMIRKT
ncbi:MAG: GNAT family N-acetyltransferase [Proteobacteria bacterium]|nr:GNAT family N-acetyltransferase [Pseudomonadota bacterium]